MRPLSVQSQPRVPLPAVPEGTLSPRTRQQRDIENALRHMKLVWFSLFLFQWFISCSQVWSSVSCISIMCWC